MFKDTAIKMQRQPIGWEKIFDKELDSGILNNIINSIILVNILVSRIY